MSDPESRFSKLRLETLCDGIFAIAMTLLVLELKVPELPRGSSPAEIWHALGEHGLSFFGFGLTFILAGQTWILHHRLFQHLRSVSRSLAVLTIPFLLFVSLLPFSTLMLTAFGPRNPVSLIFYLGNQFALSALLAAHWLIARRSALLAPISDGRERRQFERMLFMQPIAFLVSLAVVPVSPRYAMLSAAMSIAVLNGIARRVDRAKGARAAVPSV